MLIHQFYDTGLAHASYAVIRAGQMVVIDPGRNPQPYYDFATLHEADLVGIIETHPHADFVSSHFEIHQTTGAAIYVSRLVGAAYPHQTFDDGDILQLADIQLRAINTPGHSPDSICILVEDENGKATTLFTGDTLFVGDVGRPDLREKAGRITASRDELARQLYHSTREKIMTLPGDVVVYPAHGPGSLCGKNISADLSTTIGRELRENYALQLMDELQFMQAIGSTAHFTPRYFSYDVELNRQGAPALAESLRQVPRLHNANELLPGILLIDTRPNADFTAGHIPGAINLQSSGKFETWLGSVVSPDEPFYLLAASAIQLESVLEKAAKIGYEKNIKGSLATPAGGNETTAELDLQHFRHHPAQYTVVDVRNTAEVNEGKHFSQAIAIPLPELRERLNEIPTDKPIVVHCAAGYRSAAASSIIQHHFKAKVPVYDLGEAIYQFVAQPV
ncbi:rhodanese-like domain-containing protein [Mucilaginibacter sp.]